MSDKREVTFGRYRVLLIPTGQKVDADGRELGDDWLLATLGCAEDGDKEYDCYVTTNRVRASESYGVLDALETAMVLVKALAKAEHGECKACRECKCGTGE